MLRLPVVPGLGIDGLTYALGHGTVGQKHELLYQLVGILRALEIYAQWLALLVYLELHLLAVEVHGSGLESPGPQLLGHPVQHDEFLGKVLCRLITGVRRLCLVARTAVVLLAGFPVVFQHLLHFLVGKPPVAPYHGMYDARILDLRLHVHLENDAEGQFLLVRPQRADEVAKPLGQHGNGPIYQIDTGGTLHGLLVDGTSLPDVV